MAPELLIAGAVVFGAWLIAKAVEDGAKLLSQRVHNHADILDKCRENLNKIHAVLRSRK